MTSQLSNYTYVHYQPRFQYYLPIYEMIKPSKKEMPEGKRKVSWITKIQRWLMQFGSDKVETQAEVQMIDRMKEINTIQNMQHMGSFTFNQMRF